MTRLLGRLGFAPAALMFSLRTGCAAVVALLLAWALGLEHPQWAAMSVWAAAQPLRGQVMAKSLSRLLGTVLGTGVGILLVLVWTVSAWYMVIGLALWVALCTLAGHLSRGYIAYGTVLSGYTAGMVALLLDPGQGDVLPLALDRMATVLTGVFVATLAGLLFAPKGASRAEMTARAETLLEAALQWLAEPKAAAEQGDHLLLQITDFNDQLDAQGIGRLRREAAKLQAPLLALIPLILARQAPEADRLALSHPAATLLRGRDLSQQDMPLALGVMYRRLEQAIALAHSHAAAPRLTRPRDVPGALQAALRVVVVLLAFGLVWQLTQMPSGNFLMLGLAVMISIISLFESPVSIMPKVVQGQFIGILLALACRWLLWPFLDDELARVLAMVPFILLGAAIFGHPKGALLGFDLNMVLLLLLSPAAGAMSLQDSLLMSVAVVSAPLIAFAAYALIFPARGKARTARQLRNLSHDLATFDSRHDRETAFGQMALRVLHYLSLSKRWGGGLAKLPQARIIESASKA